MLLFLFSLAVATATPSTPWPLPLNLTRGAGNASISPAFSLSCDPSPSCSPLCTTSSLVAAGFSRYTARMRPPPATLPAALPTLDAVVVCVASGDETLGPATDESYTLAVPSGGTGALSAPTVFGMLFPAHMRVAPRIDADYLVLVVAGLLVGMGTSYASGCTSGHGVCGLSRLSPRSLVATASFMAAGFLVIFVVRHLLQGAST